jgi:CrcB protein
MFKLTLLMLGGALGTAARYGLNGWVSGFQGKHYAFPAVFPLGTMAVNVLGCFIVGFLAALSDETFGRAWIKPEWRDFLIIGFCGGFTTFSSYGIQTLNLARDGEWLMSALNIAASNILGLLAVYVGLVAGRLLQAKLHGGGL